MAAALAQLKPGLEEILVIAYDLKDKTIESAPSKSDEGMITDILSGKLKPPT